MYVVRCVELLQFLECPFFKNAKLDRTHILLIKLFMVQLVIKILDLAREPHKNIFCEMEWFLLYIRVYIKYFLQDLLRILKWNFSRWMIYTHTRIFIYFAKADSKLQKLYLFLLLQQFHIYTYTKKHPASFIISLWSTQLVFIYGSCVCNLFVSGALLHAQSCIHIFIYSLYTTNIEKVMRQIIS